MAVWQDLQQAQERAGQAHDNFLAARAAKDERKLDTDLRMEREKVASYNATFGRPDQRQEWAERMSPTWENPARVARDIAMGRPEAQGGFLENRLARLPGATERAEFQLKRNQPFQNQETGQVTFYDKITGQPLEGSEGEGKALFAKISGLMNTQPDAVKELFAKNPQIHGQYLSLVGAHGTEETKKHLGQIQKWGLPAAPSMPTQGPERLRAPMSPFDPSGYPDPSRTRFNAVERSIPTSAPTAATRPRPPIARQSSGELLNEEPSSIIRRPMPPLPSNYVPPNPQSTENRLKRAYSDQWKYWPTF